MTWTIEFQESARKDLRRLSPPDAQRILRFLRERIAPANDPRMIGKPLTGGLAVYWRYRVGSYRILCEVFPGSRSIRVRKIAHRSEVYER